VLFDDNGISIDGPTSLSMLGSTRSRASRPPAGRPSRIDGHDPKAIAAAIEQARSQRPAVADRLPHGDRLRRANRQGTEKAHGAPLGAEEIEKTRARWNWPHAPFQIPEAVLAQWREIGARGMRPPQLDRAEQAPQFAGRSPFHDALNRKLPCGYADAMAQIRDPGSAPNGRKSRPGRPRSW
jgi:transketolase